MKAEKFESTSQLLSQREEVKMSAKVLYSLSDENRDLQRHIGCMNGIFQLFDRHHFLSGRRIHQNHRRLSASGNSENHGTKPKSTLQRPTEKNMKRATKEKQKVSTESSRTSFSSSGSSILSSIDNKHSQPESSLHGQTNFPRTASRDLPVYQPNNSLQLSQQPVDIRAVVKDSMYREAREVAIKTKHNAGGQTLKYMDSPRPLQQPKSLKSRVLVPNESFCALSKLQEDSFVAKDAPRFSYDGWESREGLKSTIKLKELARLSLDSRERSMRGSTSEMKSNNLLGDLQRINGNPNNILNQWQDPGSYRRASSVVAKLMGLEAFPDSTPTNGNQRNQMKTFPDTECYSFTQISKTTDEHKKGKISGSPRNSIKEPILPQMKNGNSVRKPVVCSKFPMEPAPWKQPDGSKVQIPALKDRDSPTRVSNSPLSVYGEIEKRLTQLEFKKSGKDLRALKHILAAMQKTKEILETRNEDQTSNFVSRTGNNISVDHNSKLANSENLESRDQASTSIKGVRSPKSSRSPIVIIKVAKPIERASNSESLATQNDCLPVLQRIHIGESTANRKEYVDKQTKDSTARSNRLRDPSSQHLHPPNKKSSAKSLGSVKTLKSSNPTTGKNRSGKSSESMNPRLQQKGLRLEKQSHSRTPSLDLSRSRVQPTESGSPHKKSRPKSLHKQPTDDQLSEISIDTRDSSRQGDTSSLQSESYVSTASNVDSEVTSIDRSYKISSVFFLQHGKKDSPAGYTEDRSLAEPVRAGPEQPSPVSVLDATFYRDEPPSPVKKISLAFKDDENRNSEAEWSLMDSNHLYISREPSFSSKNDYNKLENMKHFNHDDMHINRTQNAPIHGSTDPNHRYISEIMLASGLLRDFVSDFLTLQLHPSGHLINPNLFFILEQMKARARLPIDGNNGKKTSCSEPSTEKAQRKLIFDAVDEILVHKLVYQESYKMFSPSKLADKSSSEKQLLRNLCAEVDRLQANSNCNLDDEDDILRSIVCQDLTHRSMDWTDCQSEVSQLALYVERLIFKDLMSEIVQDETDGLIGHHGRYCRRLFSK